MIITIVNISKRVKCTNITQGVKQCMYMNEQVNKNAEEKNDKNKMSLKNL